MQISFTCPSGHKLRARPEKAGTEAVCPACGAKVDVPPLPPQAKVAADRTGPLKRPPLVPPVAASAAPPPLPPLSPAATPPPLLTPRATDLSEAPQPTPPPIVSPPPTALSAEPTAAKMATAPPEESPRGPAVRGYRPDRFKLASVYWLGLALLTITIIEMLPAVFNIVHASIPFVTISGAPAWAQAVLVLGLLQLAYVAWMVSLPDWSTTWTLMAIYGLAAAAYGYVLAVSMMTPRDQELLLGLDAVRRLAPLWCAAMVLLTFLAAFLCGRTSTRWHRAYVALVKARGLR